MTLVLFLARRSFYRYCWISFLLRFEVAGAYLSLLQLPHFGQLGGGAPNSSRMTLGVVGIHLLGGHQEVTFISLVAS